MSKLDIRYATAPNGGRIAFGRAGSGPGFVFMPGHVCMSRFEEAPWVQSDFIELASTHTFVAYDHLGGGLSTRQPRDFSMSGLVAELEAVLDAAGIESAVLYTCSTDTPPAICFAAEHPDRVTAFCIANGFPQGNDRMRTSRARAYMQSLENDWGLASDAIARLLMGWSDKSADELAAYIRGTTSHEIFLEFVRAANEFDASGDLERVQAPTLVMHTPNPTIPVEVSQEMASRIPDARLVFVELAGSFRPLLDTIRPFLASLGQAAPAESQILTGREREILCRICAGASNESIATELTVSTRTVERHVQNVYSKLGVHNRVEATNWAREHGVV